MQLKNLGFNHITLAVNYQAEIIKAYFGNGSKLGIKIDYSLEPKPLGTMGPLSLIPDLPENFLVMNGDILTDLDFKLFFNNHKKGKEIFSISASKRVELINYGLLKIDSKNNLIDFEEKPKNQYLVSMGIYAMSKKILKYIPKNRFFGFDDLMLTLLNKKITVKVNEFNGYWRDIGRPEDYSLAIEEFEDKKKIILGNE